jgi:hypothetical protein
VKCRKVVPLWKVLGVTALAEVWLAVSYFSFGFDGERAFYLCVGSSWVGVVLAIFSTEER